MGRAYRILYRCTALCWRGRSGPVLGHEHTVYLSQLDDDVDAGDEWKGVIGMPVLKRDFLFAETEWIAMETNQREALVREIDGMPAGQLLNGAIDSLCDYFEEKYSFHVPSLQKNKISVAYGEVDLDVSQDPLRVIRDRSRPFLVRGTLIKATVPFTGLRDAFRVKPTTSTSSPPKADVQTDSLLIRIQGVGLEGERVEAEINQTVDKIERYLAWLRRDAEGFNVQVRRLAADRIAERRDKLIADRSLVEGLSFPLTERPDARRTYAVPEIQKRITPQTPPQLMASPGPLEPTLAADDYEHILSVMENMAEVMERSPSAFKDMGEEALRWHFLVQLNGQYEGQATGETFNYGGKTDIFVRYKEKNVFIAECKYWSGPSALRKAVDQLLGYLTWHEAKTALIIFNRNRNFSKVLATIPNAMKDHPNYKREVPQSKSGRFRCVLSHQDDSERDIILTILTFDVPKPDEAI